jgi:hypothetical protein
VGYGSEGGKKKDGARKRRWMKVKMESGRWIE